MNAGAEAGVDRTPLLARWMIGALGARAVQVTRFEKLGGGAIQENWALDASVTGGPQAGRLELVLRTDAPSRVAASHSRAQEFALLRAAWQAGVAVPEPVAIDPRGEALGKPFYLMRRLAGTAAGHVLVRDDRWRGDRPALAARLGREGSASVRISIAVTRPRAAGASTPRRSRIGRPWRMRAGPSSRCSRASAMSPARKDRSPWRSPAGASPNWNSNC